MPTLELTFKSPAMKAFPYEGFLPSSCLLPGCFLPLLKFISVVHHLNFHLKFVINNLYSVLNFYSILFYSLDFSGSYFLIT